MKLWCAEWRVDGKPIHCAIQRQANPPPKYEDSLAVVCGQWVTLTTGIEKREPTCADCRKALKLPSLRKARAL